MPPPALATVFGVEQPTNEVRCGNRSLPWCRYADGRTAIDLRHLDGISPEMRRVRTFKDHEKAITWARSFLLKLSTDGTQAFRHTAGQLAQLDAALVAIAPTGLTLEAVVNAGLAAIARPVHLIADIAQEFLCSKGLHDLNARYRRALCADVLAFAKARPGDVAATTPRHVEAFIAAHCASAGPRRRNAARDHLCALFAFARDRNYLPADKRTAPTIIERVDAPPPPISVFSPAEMKLFLEHVREDFLPWLAINAFSGVRVEEIVLSRDAANRKDPLRWEDFDWPHREISVRSQTAKTGRPRRIPLLDNLAAWLAPWRDGGARGPVCSHHPGDYEIRRLVSAARATLARDHNRTLLEVEWRKNALRHSFGSYRMAELRNEHQLAYEMGNSVEIVRRHYHNPRPPSEAASWFSITPTAAANVIQLSLTL